MFNATELAHAQREYVGNVIEILHTSEADLIKKIERQASREPTNFRGRREPLEVAPNPSLSFGNPDGGILATPGAPAFNHLLIPYVWLNTGLETSYNAKLYGFNITATSRLSALPNGNYEYYFNADSMVGKTNALTPTWPESCLRLINSTTPPS